jgi:hypothetical protein
MYYLVAGTGAFNVSLVGKPKRLASWNLSAAGAQTVNMRDGSATGPIVIPLKLAAGTSAGQAYEVPQGCPLFTQGLFVEVTGAGALTGSVNLV